MHSTHCLLYMIPLRCTLHDSLNINYIRQTLRKMIVNQVVCRDSVLLFFSCIHKFNESNILYKGNTSILDTRCMITDALGDMVRHGKCTGKDVKQETMSRNVPLQDFISTQDVYDTAEDNTTYQTLGQLSGSSHYDQLQLKTPS